MPADECYFSLYFDVQGIQPLKKHKNTPSCQEQIDTTCKRLSVHSPHSGWSTLELSESRSKSWLVTRTWSRWSYSFPNLRIGAHCIGATFHLVGECCCLAGVTHKCEATSHAWKVSKLLGFMHCCHFHRNHMYLQTQ